jgi:hypothetical protein
MKFNMNTIVQPGDVVGVYVTEKLSFFARVEEIGGDVKPGWLNLRLRVLTVPTSELTWILEPSQIDGEPFTMGGTAVRIERLEDPKPIWLDDGAVDGPELAQNLDGPPSPSLVERTKLSEATKVADEAAKDEESDKAGQPHKVAEVISFPFRDKDGDKS